MKQPKFTLLGMILLTLTFCFPTFAQNQQAFSADQVSKLAPIKHKVNAAVELQAKGVITSAQAEQAILLHLSDASSIAGRSISVAELASVPDPISVAEPTWLSRVAARVAGWITFVNILWTLGAIVAAVSFLILFWRIIADFLKIFAEVPVVVYEVIVYALAIAVTIYGRIWLPNYGHYLGLLGSIVLGAWVAFSFYYHKADLEDHHTAYFGILTGIFGATAVYYSSTLIGVFASISFMGMLGFAAAVGPFCYAVGFKDDNTLARATMVSFLVLALYIVLRLINVQNGIVEVFAPGMLFMGSFVGYLGLLIASSKWYDRDSQLGGFGGRQVITVVFGMAALFFGSVLDIPILMKVGGTFFALYLLEKLLDVISSLKIENGYAIAFIGLLIAGSLIGSGVFISRHVDTFGPYLLFL